METFWDNKHSTQDNYWLTGSSGREIVETHRLQNIQLNGIRLLEIGVGKGTFTKYTHDAGCYVIGCDISHLALENVRPFVSEVYHTSQLNKIEPVDLAVCHLVFQHCTDEEIERIIHDVKLKPNGIFSFQFAFLRENEEPNDNVKTLIKNGTHYFRSLKTIEDMATRSNKKVVEISHPIHHYGRENFSWYFVKLGNAT